MLVQETRYDKTLLDILYMIICNYMSTLCQPLSSFTSCAYHMSALRFDVGHQHVIPDRETTKRHRFR